MEYWINRIHRGHGIQSTRPPSGCPSDIPREVLLTVSRDHDVFHLSSIPFENVVKIENMIDLARFMCLNTYFSIKIWVRDYTLAHLMQESDDVLKGKTDKGLIYITRQMTSQEKSNIWISVSLSWVIRICRPLGSVSGWNDVKYWIK